MNSKMNLILERQGHYFLWEVNGEYLFETLVMPTSACYSSVTIRLNEEQKKKILADHQNAFLLAIDINHNITKYQKAQGVSIADYL